MNKKTNVLSQKVKIKVSLLAFVHAAAASGWLAQTCTARHNRYFKLTACWFDCCFYLNLTSETND